MPDQANELLAETEHHEEEPQPKNHKGLDPTGQAVGILDISG
ncbi:hypothetical protein [Blastopirellula sediminis]|nr:hypothetical protein [Blastopirellula sediminis]